MKKQFSKKVTLIFLSFILLFSYSFPSWGIAESSAKSKTQQVDDISEYTKTSISKKIDTLLSNVESNYNEEDILNITTEIKDYIPAESYLGFNRLSSPKLIELIKQLIPLLKDKEEKREWALVALGFNKIVTEDVEIIVSGTTLTKKAQAEHSQIIKQYKQAVKLYEEQNYTATISHVRNSFYKFFDMLSSIKFEYKLDGDKDKDGLLEIEELTYKTNPLKADTDGDGLSDSFEMQQSYTNPLKIDSDGNGIGDEREDIDGDKLTNKQEQELHTNPLKSDTDEDGLSDGEEVKASTNPTEGDTDQDKLLDGEEPALGFQPTNQDTDGNGIIDGDEIVTVTTRPENGIQDELVVPSVKIKSSATGSSTTSITSLKERNTFVSEEIPGYIGSAYEFETEVEFDEAEMTFAYDRSVVTEEFRPEIFYYNKNTQQLERVENQTHDSDNHTVTADVTHFSTYLLLNGVEWDKAWSKEVGLPSDRDEEDNGEIQYIDLVFAIDSSGSMSWNDPNELRKTAVKNFIDTLLEEDKGAVVDFDSDANIVISLTSDKQKLKVAVDTIDDSGGTNIYSALTTSLDEVLKGQNSKKYVILLTDGDGTWHDSALKRAIDNQVSVYTIGLGSSIDINLLKKIASETGGKYYHASTANELGERFGEVADETTGNGDKDSDNDGLSDLLETNGIRVGNGKFIKSDPNNSDTDGDGLLDGEEIFIDNYNNNQYGLMSSEPNKRDSDNDGLDDYTEVEFGTDAFDSDTDGDGLNDSKEIKSGFDALNNNPDKDSYLDSEEMKNGTDPFIYDATTWEFSQNLLLGALWGDGGKTALEWGIISSTTYNSIAFLTGKVLSGIVAIGDIRDAVGNLVDGNPWGVVLSLVGIVPVVGDGTKIIADIVSFANRTSNNLDKAVYFVDKILRKIDNSLADEALSKLLRTCNCFSAGTKVLTDTGQKSIEEIDIGDQVLSKNDETGETAYKEVIGLFQKDTDEIYSLQIGNEKMKVTAEHPFWLDEKGWTQVEELKIGDLLVTSDGQKLPIENITKEKTEETVYNFEVEGFRSYFVTNLGIWVHNCNIGTFGSKTIEHIFHGRTDGVKVSGYHHKNINSPYTLSNVSSPNQFGVYKARVTFNGQSKFSTFFPENWNRTDVLNAIKEAKTNVTVSGPGWYEGTTPSGMKIRMWINNNGLIDTAFPIY
ncbi:polymorphic toxin-type HINT domain-containing protein [Metabacillus litoralis]|uniref:polymorphic toxin-type HINT domain-containing protein n=1 Tax=Metabacillus litoralis TaxID=152268 RepID=UPI001CFD6142|nr:polymorphic toxin-type HINT domain-containing protein [Metabacillus litoralis]